jgi:hypothetical protein
MIFNDERPKNITIMADYGDSYAWDEDGASTGLGYYFPEIPEVAEIEAELKAWSSWFSTAEEFDPNFPWKEFHQKGLNLAYRLHQVIKDTGTPVFYWPPFEDPQRGSSEKIAISDWLLL